MGSARNLNLTCVGRYSDIVITLVDFQVLGLKSPYLDIALGRSHAGERVKVEVGVSLFFLLLFPILFLMIFPVSRHGSPTCELTREPKRLVLLVPIKYKSIDH